MTALSHAFGQAAGDYRAADCQPQESLAGPRNGDDALRVWDSGAS